MIYAVFFIFTFFILFFAFYQWQHLMIFTPVHVKDRSLCEACEYLSIHTDDGVELEGIVYEPVNAVATLLIFVGRSHDAVALMRKLSECYPDLRLITFNYRGYGKSGGKVSEKHLLSDGVKIAQLVQKHYGDFYLLGFSLGSNVAAFIASKQKVKALFLVGAFDSIVSLSKTKYPKLCCASQIVRYKLPTESYVKNVDAPTYLFASRDDETVFIENTRKLRDAVKHLQLYQEFEGISHRDILWEPEVCNTINKVIKNG